MIINLEATDEQRVCILFVSVVETAQIYILVLSLTMTDARVLLTGYDK